MKKQYAVVLLSGGLDSATSLYWAIKNGFNCTALIFNYGQRHKREIISAKKISRKAKIKFEVVNLKLPWLKKSSLVDTAKKLPQLKSGRIKRVKIPSTYVAARNIIMMSVALSYGDVISANAIVIGANVIDYSGYPDCRPNFIKAFQKAARLGSESKKIKIITPLIKLSKTQIVKLALKLKVPIGLTWSCYAGGKVPCDKCDSCKIRAEGFKKLGLIDPLI
jgi:7-cyano-7-deazaguanine synthase